MLIVLLSYFVGSILGGKIYGLLIHRDLAKEGSGNTGARNAMRIGGKKAFLKKIHIGLAKKSENCRDVRAACQSSFFT